MQIEQDVKRRQERLQRGQKVGTKYEDFLINRGYESKIKLQMQALKKEIQLERECTFTPRINNKPSTARNREKAAANSSIFETLYRRAEKMREKSSDWREYHKAEEAKKLTENCTFKPNLTKGRGVGTKQARRNMTNEESRVVSQIKATHGSELPGTNHQMHHSIF